MTKKGIQCSTEDFLLCLFICGIWVCTSSLSSFGAWDMASAIIVSGVFCTCQFRNVLSSNAENSGFEICSNMCGCINFEQVLYTRPVICCIPTHCNIGFNPLNAELNPICHLLALLGAHHILHVSGVRVKQDADFCKMIPE